MQSAKPQFEHHTKYSSLDDSSSKVETDKQQARADSDKNDETDENTSAPWRALFFFTTKRHLSLLIAGVLLSVAGGLVSPATSYVMGKVFEGFSSFAAGKLEAEEFMRKEKNYVYYLVVIAGIDWVILFFDFVAWLSFGELQAKSARDRLFHGLLQRDIAWYDMRKNGIGALLPRIQAQVRELQLATSQPLGGFVTIIATAVLSLVQALVRAWDLTLVTIATVPVVMLAVAWVSKDIQQNLNKHQDKLTEAQKFSTNALSSIETVKCFNGQQVEEKKYTKCVTEAAQWYYRVANANALQMGLVVLLSVSMFVQGFYYGGVLVASGKRSTADVVTTFLSAVAAFQALIGILPQLMVLAKGRIAGSTLRAIVEEMEQDSSTKEGERLVRPTCCRGNIEMKNVKFSYPSRRSQMALDDVSLSIPSGGLTFLIGKSGSGKSTLGQLLLRFYSPTSGTVTLDGTDLSLLDATWLREKITLVEQTSTLFNNTLFQNIAFGSSNRDKVTKQDVVEAAEFALLRSMIGDLSHGLETLVADRGSSMSGGQRQRVALARARLRDAPVLILDESASALDQISCSLMMDAIRVWRQGKTTIVITHDIAQVLPDDYVYVLDRGRLAQEGYRKHMERIPRSPFQAFLPEELPGRSPRRSMRPAEPKELFIHQSPDYSLNRLGDRHSDTLESQLNATDNKRATLWSAVLQTTNDIPRPAFMLTGGKRMSNTWAQTSLSPPTMKCAPSPSPSKWSRPWSEKNNEISTFLFDEPDTRSEGRMDVEESLIEERGRLAAHARLTQRRIDRRRPDTTQSSRVTRSSGQSFKRGKGSADDESGDSATTHRQSLRQITSTLWPSLNRRHKSVLILGFWGASIHAIATPIFSFVLSKLLKLYSIPGGAKHQSLVYSMVILTLAIVDATHAYLFRYFLEYVSQCWVNSVRKEAITRLLDQPREFFDHEENAGSRLAGHLDRNGEEMRNLLGRFIGLIWIAAIMVTVSVAWAMAAQWKMTLIALAVAPYIYLTTKVFAVISENWESRSNDAAEDAAMIFTETFTNIKTVRALTIEQHFLNKYVKATNHTLKVGYRRSFISGFFYALSDSAGNFSIALVFYVGARLVASGTSVEAVIQVFTMLIFAIENVSAILAFVPQIGSSKDTASRLLRLAQLSRDSHEHVGEARMNHVGDIRLNNLDFSYPSRPEQTVLSQIDLRIEAGTSTAIVGGSGSGKSTIANLLLRLYSTSSTSNRTGTSNLTLSSRDITQIDTSSLRSLVVPVSQSPTLFPASVAENISYGLDPSSPYNTPTAIETAARLAGVHDFILSLPQSYSTAIGDGGTGLSGGQAQRIAIARALIRRPSVLILDEATSALDAESAGLVRQTIESLVKRKDGKMTVIIITHAREMMEIAEKIVVLDRGRVVEEGEFGDLLGRNGPLANLLRGGEWNGEEGYGR